MSGQQHAPAALYPQERPGTHCTGGWVGPRAGLDGRKISSPPGNFPVVLCLKYATTTSIFISLFTAAIIAFLYNMMNLSLRSSLLWDFSQRRLVVCYVRLGTTYRFHLQGSSTPRRMPQCFPPLFLDCLIHEDRTVGCRG